jgi:hypothetical protein
MPKAREQPATTWSHRNAPKHDRRKRRICNASYMSLQLAAPPSSSNNSTSPASAEEK